MKLQSVAPPESGSLSVVYSCPECGYEVAMLTNPYETQLVQSLGVRIGPGTDSSSGPSASAGPSTSGGKCPFPAMMPADGQEAQRPQTGEPLSVRWTAAAEARLANIPAFVRPMAKTGIEKFAQDNGAVEVDEKILDAAREFFGM